MGLPQLSRFNPRPRPARGRARRVLGLLVALVGLVLGLALLPSGVASAAGGGGGGGGPTCFAPTFGTSSTFTFELDCGTIGGAVTDYYTDGATGVRFGSPADLGWPNGVAQSCDQVGPPTLKGGADLADLPSGSHYLEADVTVQHSCIQGEFNTAGMFFECVTVCTSVSGYVGTETIADTVTWNVTAYGPDGSVVQTVKPTQGNGPGAAYHSPLVPFTLTGSHATPIQWVRLTNDSGIQPSVWLDDLTYNADPSAVPEYVDSVPLGYANGTNVSLHPGDTFDVPVAVNRHNGSSGDITMSSSSDINGASVTWSTPVFSGFTSGTTTAHIAIDPSAVPSGSGTVTLDSSAPGSAGTKRGAPIVVNLIVNPTLAVNSPSLLSVAPCSGERFLANVTVPQTFAGTLLVSGRVHDQTLNTDVQNNAGWSLGLSSTRGLPIVLTGTGNGVPQVLIDLTAPAGFAPSRYVMTVDVAVSGHANDKASWTALLQPAPLTGSVSTTTVVPPVSNANGTVTPGSTVTLTAAGVCAGTDVVVGNDLAPASLTPIGPDTQGDGTFARQKYTFVVPAYATGGKLQLRPTSGPRTDVATVTSSDYRNTNGFRFDNYPVNDLVYDDMVRAFGEDQMYDKVDLCFPFHCYLKLRDPVAMIWTALVRSWTVGTGGSGHCWGMAATAARMVKGAINPVGFPHSGVAVPYSLDSTSGPSPALAQVLQAAHLQQFSIETFGQVVGQSTAQLISGGTVFKNALKSALAQGPALIAMRDGGDGHVVLAYGYEDAGNGQWYVDVVDPNRPYRAAEDTDSTGALHKLEWDTSRISVNDSGWHFQMARQTTAIPPMPVPGGADWQASWGNLNSGIAVFPYSHLTSTQHIPSLGSVFSLANSLVAFGSTAGTGKPPVAPTLSAGQTRVTLGQMNGGLVSSPAGHPVTLTGTGAGAYTAATFTSGGAAQVDTRSASGSADVLTPLAGGVGFTPGATKAVTLTSAGRSSGGLLSVQVSGVVPKHSVEQVTIGRSGLSVTSAAGGTLAVQSTVSAPRSAPVTEMFRVVLKAGETATATPSALRAAGGLVRLSITGRHGHRLLVIRSATARAAALGVPAFRSTASPAKHKAVLHVSVPVSRPARDASGVLTIVVYAGRRLVGSTTVTVAHLRSGAVTGSLTVSGRGTYRVQVVLTVTHARGVAGTTVASKVSTIHVG